jgi:hypothetical protein
MVWACSGSKDIPFVTNPRLTATERGPVTVWSSNTSTSRAFLPNHSAFPLDPAFHPVSSSARAQFGVDG